MSTTYFAIAICPYTLTGNHNIHFKQRREVHKGICSNNNVCVLMLKGKSHANLGAGEYFGKVRIVFDERGNAAWGGDDDVGAAR